MEPERLVGSSTRGMYYWVDMERWKTEQLRVAELLRRYVSRLEIYLSPTDIQTLTAQERADYRRALEGCALSLHLPDLPADPAELRPLVAAYRRMVEELSIEYCVLHADAYHALGEARRYLELGAPVGLENSDGRKTGFQHLRELAAFLPIPAVLDICHLEEVREDCFDEEIGQLANPLVGIHFSTLHNEYYRRFPYIETYHHLFTRSGRRPPAALPRGVPLVLEAVYPRDEFGLIEEEVALARKLGAA